MTIISVDAATPEIDTFHKAARHQSGSHQAGRTGIEPAGTPLQQLAQKLIHRERARLATLSGVVSFGRSVAAFDPAFETARLAEIVGSFRRVLLMGQIDRTKAIATAAIELGADVSEGMPMIGAGRLSFLPAAKARLATFSEKPSGTLSVLADDASNAEIREIQDLQVMVGLTPLPGAFLRGSHGRVSTVLLRDPAGRLRASATTVDLADVGGEYMETAILVGVSVHPQAQGQGLGSLVTAAGLVAAESTFGADRVIAVVSPTNTRALRTNAKFGMHPLRDQTAIYVEMSGTA